MKRIPRRENTFHGIFMLAGAALATAAIGCGGGDSSDSPDVGGGKQDALVPVGPEVGKDSAPIPPDLGSGGTGGSDAAPDQAGTGGTGGVDGGLPDTRLPIDVTMPDVAIADVAVDGSPDKPMDGGPSEAGAIDGAGGTTACRSPVSAWSYAPIMLLGTVAWDTDGQIVTGGSSYKTLFGTTTIPNNGSADMLVAKINPSTGVPTWVSVAGDPSDQYLTGVASSSAGLGAIGNFLGTLEVVSGTPMVNSSSASVDFIAGLKAGDGAGVWSKKVSLGTGGRLRAIAGHPSKDYFVVCGDATNSAANLGATGTPGGGFDVVVAAVKASDGTVLWAKLFGGAGDQSCYGATIDDAGNAMVTGSFNGTLDFGLGALSPAPSGASDQAIWVAKLDGATGAALAARAYGAEGRWATPSSVGAGPQGNVVVTGSFQKGPLVIGGQSLDLVGKDNAFVAMFDANLTPVWARRWGTTGAGGAGVGVASGGSVIVVGTYTDAIDVGPGTTVLTASAPSKQEIFVVTLEGGTGATICGKRYGDSASGGQGASAIAINRWALGGASDRVAISGVFNKLADFGQPTTPLTAEGNGGFLLLE